MHSLLLTDGTNPIEELIGLGILIEFFYLGILRLWDFHFTIWMEVGWISESYLKNIK